MIYYKENVIKFTPKYYQEELKYSFVKEVIEKLEGHRPL